MNIKGTFKTSNRCMKFRVAFHPLQRWLALTAIGLLTISATFRVHALPIKNGGFETGDLTGWGTIGGLDGGVTTAEAFRGSYSLELAPADIVYQELEISKCFETLEFSAKADDSFWTMTEDASTAILANAIVQYSDGALDIFEFGALLVSEDYDPTSDNWKKFSFALDSAKSVARVFFVAGIHNPVPIYIDHIGLRDFH
jgi:hypothetical protein